MTAMLPAHLTETINNLGDAARSLAEEVRADRERRDAEAAAERVQRRREARRMTALLAIVGVLVAALAALSVSNRLLGNQNRAIAEEIRSCTNDDGACARKGQQRTGDAIGKLIRMNVEVTACARGAATDAEYRKCVDVALLEVMGDPTTQATPPSSPPTSPPVTPEPTPGVGG